MTEPEQEKKSRVSSEDAKRVLIESVIELFQTIPTHEITTRRISEHAGFDTKTIFRNFESLEGLYVAALRSLETHLIRDDPVTQYAPLPSTQIYLEFYAWLVHAGLPKEKLAADKEFSETLRVRSYERLGLPEDLSERAKQAFLNLGVEILNTVRPVRVSTDILPPCSKIIFWQIANPRPMPGTGPVCLVVT